MLGGQIEARGVGILDVQPHDPAPLCLIVDLGHKEDNRLPDRKAVSLLGHDIRVFHTPVNAYFVDAIMHYMLHDQTE